MEKTNKVKENSEGMKIALAKESKKEEKGLTAVVRISGAVKVREKIENTLGRLRLKRKYSCVLIDSNKKSVKGMLDKVKHYVAYGVIDKKTLVKLINERGKSIEGNKKKIEINPEEIAEGLSKGKKLINFKLKPFFRLHPPRKGIKSKLQYPKGVLGNNKHDINKLIGRML